MGAILSIFAGLIKVIGSALGWAHDRSEQQQGAELQQLSTFKQATEDDNAARLIDQHDSGLTDGQLDDKLRQ